MKRVDRTRDLGFLRSLGSGEHGYEKAREASANLVGFFRVLLEWERQARSVDSLSEASAPCGTLNDRAETSNE